MRNGKIRIYTTCWCGDSFRAKTYLENHGIDFEEIDIERNETAMAAVMDANDGKRRTPTLEIAGKFYGNPAITELAQLVGLEKAPRKGVRASK